jgi:hypothetical protein
MSARRDRDDLDRELHRLAASIETSPPADYPERVRRALAGARPHTADAPRRVRPGALRRVAVAAVAAVAIAVALAVPASRSAIASWFGFSGIEISRESPRATPSAQETTPAPFGAGTPVSLAQAQRAMGRSLRLPAELRSPDDVLLMRDQGAVVVTTAYRSAFGLPRTSQTGYALVVTEIGFAGEPLLEKILQSGASAVAVTVAGRHPGVFIAGPQSILSLDATRGGPRNPTVHEVAPRTSANTVIWNDGVVTYRVEGDFQQAGALRIADLFG